MPDRIIKESCCSSDTLNELSDWAERFWWRLTVVCDDFGRFDARPEILKARLFPLRDGKTKKDMANALAELASAGLITLYEVGGRPFLQVVKWSKHQRCRAQKSKFPAPLAGSCCQVPSNAPENENENEYENEYENESENECENGAPTGAAGVLAGKVKNMVLARRGWTEEDYQDYLKRVDGEFGGG